MPCRTRDTRRLRGLVIRGRSCGNATAIADPDSRIASCAKTCTSSSGMDVAESSVARAWMHHMRVAGVRAACVQTACVWAVCVCATRMRTTCVWTAHARAAHVRTARVWAAHARTTRVRAARVWPPRVWRMRVRIGLGRIMPLNTRGQIIGHVFGGIHHRRGNARQWVGCAFHRAIRLH